MTTRLYYTEPSRREFDAIVTRVVRADPEGSRLRVRLDRTAFYPTSGGQPHDTGTLGGARVIDVLDEETGGEIDHLVEGELHEGEAVRGVVHWERRADHMQQHTGQHVLSAAFDRLARARTVSFHLGEQTSTIDLSPEVGSVQVTAAEREANRIVWENRTVSIRFVSPEEAASLPLRKEPARGGRLRLIEVEAFDLSACGGTHVARTGEIGTIAVLGTERFKGGTRLGFVCGRRALDAWREHRETVVAATRLVSTLPTELPAGIERLLAENRELRRHAKLLSQRLAIHEAQALAARAVPAGGHRLVAEVVEGYDAGGLKALAVGVVSAPGCIAVLFSPGRPALVAAARSADVAVDCAAIVGTLLDRFGGRGGGRPEMAQGGGLDASAADLLEAARALVTARS